MTTKRNTKASTRTTTKRNTKRETPNPDYRAVLSVYGEVTSFYEGEKAVYLTIKVWNDREYYSLITVTVCYDMVERYGISEGVSIGLTAHCNSFFDNNSNRTIPIFSAYEITAVND